MLDPPSGVVELVLGDDTPGIGLSLRIALDAVSDRRDQLGIRTAWNSRLAGERGTAVGSIDHHSLLSTNAIGVESRIEGARVRGRQIAGSCSVVVKPR